MSGVAALVDPAARRFGAPPRMPDRPPRCRAVAPTNEIPATARHPRDTCIRAPPHTARTHAWRFPPQRNAPLAVAPNVAAHGGPPPAETHSHNFAAPLVAQAPRAAARADRQTKAARHDALAIPVQIAAPGVGHSRSNDEVNDETQQ
ncbi:hypothetical protein TR70_5594 [Burkholderia pseudomallei]|uniref:hypothetical protein n=1 Tax=Burkholderia pseudomallei TaxID=28450 RepID=UPI00070614E3|nr:hypothetical protein [Burkholderia pseudomallei]ALJ74680.1 hypothetical protein TR70_5594 [Burkholderia pseudomallei]